MPVKMRYVNPAAPDGYQHPIVDVYGFVSNNGDVGTQGVVRFPGCDRLTCVDIYHLKFV